MAALKPSVFALIAVFHIPQLIRGISFSSNSVFESDNIQPIPKIVKSLQAKLIQAKDTDKFPIIIKFKGEVRKAFSNYKEDPIHTRENVQRGKKIQTLVNKLEEHAFQTQADVIEFLLSKNVKFRQIWIANEIFVGEASPEVIRELEYFEDIAIIRQPIDVKRKGKLAKTTSKSNTAPHGPILSRSVTYPDFNLVSYGKSDFTNQNIPQPIQQINGRCSEINCLGDGVVVAVFDSGVLQTHMEIKDSWRPDYGWFDPLFSTLTPNVDELGSSQGTSAVALITGKNVGVAPNAQWIFCKAIESSIPFSFAYQEDVIKACAEWALCPSLPDGSGRDCSKAPDIISNNWLVNNWDLLDIPQDTFYSVQAAWNEAGIISFFQAGDAGPYCSSIESPALYDISFAVGTVDNSSKTTHFSARGPVLNEGFPNLLDPNSGMGSCREHCGSGGGYYEEGYGGTDLCTLIKPDLSAPGNNINTSTVDSDTSYALVSSTALSASYVSGVAALMVCANRQNNHGWENRLDWWTTGNILKETANRKRIDPDPIYENVYPNSVAWESNLLCNKVNGVRGFPNNIYGWGEVDACGAVRAVKKKFS